MADQAIRIRPLGRRPHTAIERLVYSTIITIFDALDAVLRWAHPSDKKLEDSPIESDQWDDAEILRRFDASSEGMSANPLSVRKISDDTLVKATWNWGAPHLEASTIEFVRRHTTIPTPRVRRRFEDEEALSIIVMDYIPGERLDHIWPSLSLWSKLWVALTLRRYIRQLRQINSSVPGPIGDSPQLCSGPMFGYAGGGGPFPDYASLSAFYNRKLEIAKKITHPDRHGNRIPSAGPDTEPFDDSRPLVFAHQDLTMRNIILGRDGRVWLVDWGLSGFYPPWFEYVSMVYASERDRSPDSWNRLIPLIGDPLFEHIRWTDRIMEALSRFDKYDK